MEVWYVWYSDGSKDTFSSDLTLELILEFADNKKSIIKIERISDSDEIS